MTSSSSTQRPFILFVEDDKIFFKICSSTIQKQVFKEARVVHALTMEKALQVLQDCVKNKDLPDLILSDCDLIVNNEWVEGQNGPDLLKKVKADNMLKKIPVVMMSSDMGAGRAKELMDAGAEEALAKEKVKVEVVKKWERFFN